MKIQPRNIFHTHISAFNISDEPVFKYLLELNNRMPDKITEEENITNQIGNTSSYSAYQRNIKMNDLTTWNAYEDDEWIKVRGEVTKFLENLAKLYVDMHHNMGTANWIKSR